MAQSDRKSRGKQKKTSSRTATKARKGTARRTASSGTNAKARGKATPDQVHQMISEAAYYKAEQRGFSGGDPEQDWFEAEAEIQATLVRSRPRRR
jgi:hypothetical protein